MNEQFSSSPAPPPRFGEEEKRGGTQGAGEEKFSPATGRPQPFAQNQHAAATASGELPSQPEPSSRRSILIFLVAGVILLLVIGGAAAAYFLLSPAFRHLPPDEVINRMLGRIDEIKSARYTLSMSLKMEPRDEDVKPLELERPELKKRKDALRRDAERLEEWRSILSRLGTAKGRTGRYPLNLAELFPGNPEEIRDPLGSPYGYRQEQGGADFTLHIQLETDAAAQKFREAMKFWGERVKESPREQLPLLRGRLVESHAGTASFYVPLESSDVSPSLAWISEEDIWGFLPSDFSGELTIQGTGKAADGATEEAGGAWGVQGNVSFSGMKLAADVKMRRKGNIFYVQLNELPTFGFLDVAAVKGKWIRVLPEDAVGTFFEDVGEGSEEETEKIQKDLWRLARLVLDLIAEEKVIQVVREYPREKNERERMYHYEITLDETKFARLYRRLAERARRELENKELFPLNEEIVTYLESPEFLKVYRALKHNTRYELWVDARTFFPRKFSSDYRFVPAGADKRFAGRQFHASATLRLNNINEPVTVEEPKQFIPFDEAYALLTKQSREEVMFRKQRRQVERIRGALRAYQKYTGRFPLQLAELTKKVSALPRAPGAKDEHESRLLLEYKKKNKPLLKTIPLDVYTQQPYGYWSNGSTYRLTYQMKLPPRREDMLRDYFYEEARRSFVEGQNTATEWTLSVEASRSNKPLPGE
jgi:hypothetical protein